MIAFEKEEVLSPSHHQGNDLETFFIYTMIISTLELILSVSPCWAASTYVQDLWFHGRTNCLLELLSPSFDIFVLRCNCFEFNPSLVKPVIVFLPVDKGMAWEREWNSLVENLLISQESQCLYFLRFAAKSCTTVAAIGSVLEHQETKRCVVALAVIVPDLIHDLYNLIVVKQDGWVYWLKNFRRIHILWFWSICSSRSTKDSV